MSDMTDKELLELAAKAAGVEGTYLKYIGDTFSAPSIGMTDRDFWNPLIDDGDALRLANKLNIDISHNSPLDNDYYVLASRCGIEMCRDSVSAGEQVDSENYRDAQCRRAIVRAAAEIGKGMA